MQASEPTPSSSWEQTFFKSLPTDDVVDLVNAANYMEMKSLYQSACRTVAELLVGKTASEMKTILRLHLSPDS